MTTFLPQQHLRDPPTHLWTPNTPAVSMSAKSDMANIHITFHSCTRKVLGCGRDRHRAWDLIHNRRRYLGTTHSSRRTHTLRPTPTAMS